MRTNCYERGKLYEFRRLVGILDNNETDVSGQNRVLRL